MSLKNDNKPFQKWKFAIISKIAGDGDDEEGFTQLFIPLLAMLLCFAGAITLSVHAIDMSVQDARETKLIVDFDQEGVRKNIPIELEEEIVLKGESEDTATPSFTFSYDYQALKDQVPQADCFIHIEGTNISYPVMWCTEEGFYLDHAPDGTKNRNGSIYLSPLNEPDFTDPLNYVFGHNMKSGLMFRGLNYYLQDGYLEKHKDCYIVTQETTKHYTLFYAESIPAQTNFKIYSKEYIGTEEYTEYIRTLSNKTGIYLPDDAELVMLVTCTTRSSQNRTVVYGYLEK